LAIQPINSTAPAQAQKDDPKLRRACTEFESLLVGQMLKEMRATVTKSDVFGSSEQEDLFRGMLDQELAGQISKTGAMGIGDLLYAQLTAPNKKR
jgi:peptidoglycan hydrolase FlgJ